MKKVAHLSDLHFGTDVPTVTQGVLLDLCAYGADLTVVSGDLTQRARRRQFESAKKFLTQLSGPTLVVPGNHDVPLYDVVRRFTSPLSFYQKTISTELNPTYRDDELLVAGINTARSLVWKAGGISREQLAHLRSLFEHAGKRVKIVVTHHPFIPSPKNASAGIDLHRASEAVSLFEDFEVDLLLAGHLHHGYTGDTRAFFPSARRSLLSVQAGTAVSRRVRHEPNAYNRIQIDATAMTVETRIWDGAHFRSGVVTRFAKVDRAWMPV